ncbi:hypothetical protein [Rasiella sp. SM2506]|uniref:hypothetical protein n=1 Tax=Rasiella sp. SM2506 TaxID=3423914 RepID=UPI003D794F48
MKNITYIFLVLLITSCQTKRENKSPIIDNPNNEWSKFQSSNQAFTIEFPTTEIKRQASDYFDNENIKRKSNAMKINLQDSISKLNFGYSVSYVHFEELNKDEFDLNDFYLLQKEHFTVITGNYATYDKVIDFVGRKGREMQFKINESNSVATYRLITVDSTYYLLQVLTSQDDSTPFNKATRKFFESFEFTTDY